MATLKDQREKGRCEGKQTQSTVWVWSGEGSSRSHAVITNNSSRDKQHKRKTVHADVLKMLNKVITRDKRLTDTTAALFIPAGVYHATQPPRGPDRSTTEAVFIPSPSGGARGGVSREKTSKRRAWFRVMPHCVSYQAKSRHFC